MKPIRTYRFLPGIQLLFIPGLVIFCMIGQAQTTRENLNTKRRQLEDEIQNTTKLLDQAKKTKETSLRDLQLINRRIGQREALIRTISQEISSVDHQIQADNMLIDKRTRELKALKEEYARMIYSAYKITKAQNKLVFIFSAEDFNQAWQRFKYYQQYTAYRRKQADRIRQIQEELSRQRGEQETIRAEKMKLAESEQQEKARLNREKQQKDRAVQDLSKKEKQLLTTLRSKQLALHKLQVEIERIIAEETRARTSGKGAKDAGLSAADIRLSSTFAANKGLLPWPTDQGVVTSTFGEHSHPVLKYVKVKNNGIDITGSQHTQVKAVFNGTVTRIFSVPNLNKVIILRHGEYLTVYSNLDEVSVSDGQPVSTQQVIGKAHYDREEGKSELNFQLWLGKTILDPQDWLRP
ncbi:MAG: peptidoglycan DD-metalloendopeptidase family protein [bacterium]